MKDLQAKLEELRADAEDCELISKLAADRAKRETFARTAAQLREIAAELERAMAARIAAGET